MIYNQYTFINLYFESNVFVSKDFKLVCHRIQELFYQRLVFSQTSTFQIKQKLKDV